MPLLPQGRRSWLGPISRHRCVQPDPGVGHTLCAVCEISGGMGRGMCGGVRAGRGGVRACTLVGCAHMWGYACGGVCACGCVHTCRVCARLCNDTRTFVPRFLSPPAGWSLSNEG